jgi:predicted Zn-dependent protease
MYDFFMRRKTENNEKIPEMVLTHPNFENRLKKINPAIGKNLLPFQLQEDFKIIKGICD